LFANLTCDKININRSTGIYIRQGTILDTWIYQVSKDFQAIPRKHQKEISPKGVYCGPKQCTEDQTSFLGKGQGVLYIFGISWDLTP